jgi:transposase
MSNRTEENSKKPDAEVPEVPERASRRRFDAEYKLRILEAADRCTEPGQLGELLRREGLYSSHLTAWRKQREEGALNGLREKKRGRKPKRRDPKDLELGRLRREKQKLEERLRQAETIIEVQKKVSEILGIPLNRPDDENA